MNGTGCPLTNKLLECWGPGLIQAYISAGTAQKVPYYQQSCIGGIENSPERWLSGLINQQRAIGLLSNSCSIRSVSIRYKLPYGHSWDDWLKIRQLWASRVHVRQVSTQSFADNCFVAFVNFLGRIDVLFDGPQALIGVFTVECFQNQLPHFRFESLAVLTLKRSGFQNRFHLTQSVGDLHQLADQSGHDALLDGAGNNQVDDLYGFVLRPQALNPPYTLFDNHRVPRQVVIDKQVGCLQVHTLSASIRAHNDVDQRFLGSKVTDCLQVALRTATSNYAGRNAHGFDCLDEGFLGGEALGEHHHTEVTIGRSGSFNTLSKLCELRPKRISLRQVRAFLHQIVR